MPQFSRSRLQEWVKSGRVLVNGASQKTSYALRGGETIEVQPAEATPLNAYAEDIPLDLLYSDADMVVVNKPAGLVVHAGAGRHSGTLVNALLHRFDTLSAGGSVERPGIVHRLDAETSGVLVVARNDTAHRDLASQFAARTVEKFYLALVHGAIAQNQGTITSPFARDPVRLTRMTARREYGRSAHTEYTVLERLGKFTYLEVRIKTGRTHQIRVHMASIGHAIAGDKLYGAPPSKYGRFFLHAHRLTLQSPGTGERLTFEAPLPSELQEWLEETRSAGSR